ncbi:MAG: hypothetical protein RML40_06255 [Bacteroidota bacterium]|nr:hypothetical protein [Candidatus Kapabacteria bacterium]MDW8220117.1 hypothetical protein [Bacteroidota bacterium]
MYTSFAALFVLNVPPFLPVRYPKQAQTSTDSLAPVEVQRSVERLLIGKRKFGIQFIWNGYGLAVIQRDGNALSINGAQYSNDSTEYCKINGTLVILSNTRLLFTGTLHLYTRDCCGVIERTGTFTFAKRGKRKFWRLQEFNQLCSQYICAYYLDIFE